MTRVSRTCFCAAALLAWLSAVSFAACDPAPYDDPISHAEGCQILTRAAHELCGPDVFLDCLAIVPCEPCCSDWSRAQTEACAVKIRAAKTCIEVGWVDCEIECRVWVE